jgi:hypothetical protein
VCWITESGIIDVVIRNFENRSFEEIKNDNKTEIWKYKYILCKRIID